MQILRLLRALNFLELQLFEAYDMKKKPSAAILVR